MNDIIKVNYDSGKPLVSGRELHGALGIKTAYKDWFPRMCEYGFTEGSDFSSKMSESTGGRPAADADISIDMAKQICMIQRTDKGREIRQYFIDLEKAWNTPDLVIARGLLAANTLIAEKDKKIELLTADNERMKPKEIFTNAVTASDSSILVRDLAKMIRQNGYPIGEKRLYKWMRENGYICQGSTEPTQRAMELGLFERIVRTVQRGDKLPLETTTTKVTGKGQVYFINKIIGEDEAYEA